MWFPDLARWRRRRPAILMYHRIERLDYDPWGLAVTPENFDAQMSFVASHCVPLKMSDFAACLQQGTLRPDHVAITFDDAYLDNLIHARPVLRTYKIPSTIFAVADHLPEGSGFWWDDWTRLVLASPDRADFELKLDGQPVQFRWDGAPADLGWRAWDPPRCARQSVLVGAYAALQQAFPAVRNDFFDTLRSRLLHIRVADERSMNVSELREYLADGSVELGSHSVSHPPLARIAPETASYEIAQSRRDLISLLGIAVTGFAYPYGSFDQTIADLVADCRYDWACTTRSGPARRSISRFQLPRIAVGNWSLDEFRRAITG